jgi:hypothetical protein
MDSYGFRVYWIDKLYFYLLTSGTGSHWFAKRDQTVALRRTRTWVIARDEQGCHHLMIPLNHGV